jgi:hypothetical protein
MLLFWPPQISQRGRIFLPYTVRAVMSLHEGETLRLSTIHNSNGATSNQLVLSPIPQSARGDLWNLKASFDDRSGLLNDLIAFLHTQDIELLSVAATSRAGSTEFFVDIDLDLRLYVGEHDGRTENRSSGEVTWPRALYARLACQFIGDLKFRTDGKPNIYLRKNHVLANTAVGTAVPVMVPMAKGWVSLGTALVDKMREHFARDYPMTPRGPRRASAPPHWPRAHQSHRPAQYRSARGSNIRAAPIRLLYRAELRSHDRGSMQRDHGSPSEITFRS